MSREKFFDKAVRSADPEPDLRGFAQDLGGHHDEGLAKPLPLPADDFGRERKLRDPLAQVPGQARDLQPGAVARELGDGIAPRRDSAAELRYDLLLVAALVLTRNSDLRVRGFALLRVPETSDLPSSFRTRGGTHNHKATRSTRRSRTLAHARFRANPLCYRPARAPACRGRVIK